MSESERPPSPKRSRDDPAAEAFNPDAVKRRRLVVRTVRVRKEDLPALLGTPRGQPLPVAQAGGSAMTALLQGPAHGRVVAARVVKVRPQLPPGPADELPMLEAHARPKPRQTVTLWSKRQLRAAQAGRWPPLTLVSFRAGCEAAAT